MRKSFVVLAPRGMGNSRAFNFSVFKTLLNALHCGDKFMAKSLLKAPPARSQFLFPGTVCSLLEKSACIFFMVIGLVYWSKLNSKVKYH